MRVFLYNSKIITEINKKEEITPDTHLLSDKEEFESNENLSNGGMVYLDTNNNLRWSGPKPNEYSVYDSISHKWIVNESEYKKYLEEKHEKLWESIKEIREAKLSGGVFVESLGKWFHTDSVSQLSYSRAKDYLEINSKETVNWKTMDGSLIEINLDNLKLVLTAIFEQSQLNFVNAEKLYHESIENESVSLDKGWSKTYDEYLKENNHE